MNTFLINTTALLLTASAGLAETAGIQSLSIDAPHHGRELSGAVYYPATAGSEVQTHAENPVFFGVPVSENAQAEQGNYPLVLLSHGMGGHFRSLAWLSTALAESGAIVVAVNHPNSTWGDFDLAEGLKHWTRTQDMSLALETVLADPELGAQIDQSRIMAAGFSYGGWTALSLGGLQGNHAGYVAHCDQYGEASSHCADLMRGEVGLQDVPAPQWNGAYRDSRITSVFAMDPGLIWGMGDGQTADMVGNVTLLSLGEGADRLLATDFDLAGLPTALPDADIVHVTPAAHFSLLPLCKPMGEAILKEEKDDPVCTDPEGADRAEIHSAVIAAMKAKLNL